MTFGITQNILMYYAVTGENNGVRISCIVFLILAYLCIIVPIGTHIHRLRNVMRADATWGTKFRIAFFFLFQLVYFIARVVIYLGYFPLMVLFQRDKARFNQEFGDHKYYLMGGTDMCLFILSLAHISILFLGLDRYTCMF